MRFFFGGRGVQARGTSHKKEKCKLGESHILSLYRCNYPPAVAACEATLVAACEATLVAACEATLVAACEATLVAACEAALDRLC